MAHQPILWTFRRCPYAIRARLALASSRVTVELREILLRNKPEAFLQTSQSGTVPTLRLPDKVIDESLEIMVWALQQNDPQRLLNMPQEGWGLITVNDGPFKAALDHAKYTTRYPDLDAKQERRKAAGYLLSLDERLVGQAWLFGDHPTVADLAILPFVRQFAYIDRAWFGAQDWPNLTAWLDHFLDSEVFLLVMNKYATWSEGDAPILFNG